MPLILAIESSCDETAAAVYDTTAQKMLSNELYSQTEQHKNYGGVVPEIAARSHLEKIDVIVSLALEKAGVTLKDIDCIGVTTNPGLSGSLLVGLSFAKSLAWVLKKPLIGINHLEGHIFSLCVGPDRKFNPTITFPHLCLSASGGHTSLYKVANFGAYELLGSTLDDAAGEAFDKIAKLMGHPYPGGPLIEQMAAVAGFKDYFGYPRTSPKLLKLNMSFSGLKTAVLYDMVKRGFYDLKTQASHQGTTPGAAGLTELGKQPEIQQQVASSLLVAIADIFVDYVREAFKQHPELTGLSFVGGVACNRYITERLQHYCHARQKFFVSPAREFCTDNAAMIAFVTSYKLANNQLSDLTLDIF